MLDNLTRILGVELLCAAQGVDFRAPLTTSAALARVVVRVRQEVETLGDDRYMAPDLERAAHMIATGAIIEAAGTPMPELGA
jgi:histidine ammonia-lyase